ncbi:cation diffusion facilitator family transporter [Sporolactobacillus putidus]|uniref:Cation transporter n=1 Tax=Sporolactobacillus putidus TaxID=492735 RepID=A0A917S8X3_9BACL|nr:cation diffusion facilitator family transporter [Sporolactobacillus putidus]GGL62122.1 cation transporter [Sporolactobacillus putidus]
MEPSRIALLSVLSNALIVLLKIIVGIYTGSIAVLSEAIHSSIDLMASAITFFSVRLSNRPADKIHPYGHGKVENISGTIETLLIFVAGIWIIYECANKLVRLEPVQLPLLGVLVMLLGAALNFFVSGIIRKSAERTHSVAMKSNAFHLVTDVYTSLGVAAGLLLAGLTGWSFFDPAIGIVLAFFIMFEAAKLIRESFPPLMDARLLPKEERRIRRIIESHQKEYIEFHNFRTRRSGHDVYIEFHLVVPSHLEIDTVDELCDRMEDDIKKEIPNAQILIHSEPEHERLNHH